MLWHSFGFHFDAAACKPAYQALSPKLLHQIRIVFPEVTLEEALQTVWACLNALYLCVSKGSATWVVVLRQRRYGQVRSVHEFVVYAAINLIWNS